MARDSRMSGPIDATPVSSGVMAVLQFLPGWVERTIGEIRAGLPIRIEYESERLASYRDWHTGVRFWWIRVHVLFHPAPDTRTEALAVIRPETADTPHPLMECELLVRAGTTQLEMWFENGSPMSPGTAWDSRYGSNYLFDVIQ